MSDTAAASPRLEYFLLGGTLLFYGLVTVLFHQHGLVWDEARYLVYAKNLTAGFYAKPGNPDIINGPGYPLVLAALLKLGAPLLVLRLMNAVFMALAAWFTFRAVRLSAGRHWALAAALVAALHPSLVRTAPILMTEALTICCTAGFAWALGAALRAERWRWGAVLAAGLAFGWLILTRVFFGNVLMAVLPLLVAGWVLWKSRRPGLLRALAVMATAFLVCVPWLAYTKAQTGQNLCWSTNGGELLYWITSTNEGENGHWFSVEDAQQKPELSPNHAAFYKPYYDLPVAEREARFKQRARENLAANPLGVFKNWLSNWSRLIFGFPRSFYPEELLIVVLVLVNGPILLLAGAAVVLGALKWRDLTPETVMMAVLVFIYLGGSSVAPALPRYSVVIWPWLGLVIATVLSRHLKVRLQ